MSYNAERIPDMLSPGGPLAEGLPAYEDRPYQRELALEVARLLEEGGRLAAEAPTGIGKSLAYGVPAAAWAVAGNGPVVVSTHTKALQEQLLVTEAPRIRGILGQDLRMRVLKGRANYLCRRRFQTALAEDAGEGTRALLERILPWTETTASGDLSSVPDLTGAERHFLSLRVASDARFCAHSGCAPDTGCFFKKARNEAGDAHILIVNHALLAVHLFGGWEVLPAFDALIVDEAHGFVRVGLDHLTLSVGPSRTAALLEELPGSRGVLPGFLRAGDGASSMIALHKNLSRLETASRVFFGKENGTPPADDPRQRYRDADEFRKLSPGSPETVLETLDQVLAEAGFLEDRVRREGEADSDSGRVFLSEVQRFAEHARSFREDLGELIAPDPRRRDLVVWKEWSGKQAFSLHRAPLELGTHLEPVLRERPASLVFTSATLAAGEDFTYFAREVGMEGVLPSVAYPSPFSFEEQAMVLAVRRGPDPRDPGWAGATAATLDGLLRDTGKRTLALFTSYRDLGRVRRALDPGRGEEAAYTVLAQGEGEEVPRLLERFRSTPRALLLGTASFWEGIDLPGDDLEILVLTRLPFGVPTDPRYQARAERLEGEGGNPFTQLYLPEAVLRFKQGFGRLIRRRSDRGVVAVLDPRLLGKGYGRRFASALPVTMNEVEDGFALRERIGAWWRHAETARGESR